eukprot:TRINITY_DN3291_c0_g2_i1.p1 TRINITY_DN3291_c0_g2~~TRINITY_DN3291_c0_g2_i1.p1  ORF type:complete len:480 (+),score=68.63 TRINITY_DN3291_c0_g2_i1:81-1520(+)
MTFTIEEKTPGGPNDRSAPTTHVPLSYHLTKVTLPFLATLFFLDVFLVVFSTVLFSLFYNDTAISNMEATLYILAMIFTIVIFVFNLSHLIISIRIYRTQDKEQISKKHFPLLWCLQLFTCVCFFATILSMSTTKPMETQELRHFPEYYQSETITNTAAWNGTVFLGYVDIVSYSNHLLISSSFTGREFRLMIHDRPYAMSLYVILLIRLCLPIIATILPVLYVSLRHLRRFIQWAVYGEGDPDDAAKFTIEKDIRVPISVFLFGYLLLMDVLLVILSSVYYHRIEERIYGDINSESVDHMIANDNTISLPNDEDDAEIFLYYIATCLTPIVFFVTFFPTLQCYRLVRLKYLTPDSNAHLVMTSLVQVVVCVVFLGIFASKTQASYTSHEDRIHPERGLAFTNEDFSSMLQHNPIAMGLYVLLLIRFSIPLLAAAIVIIWGFVYCATYKTVDPTTTSTTNNIPHTNNNKTKIEVTPGAL